MDAAIGDPSFSFRRFAVLCGGLSYWSRFAHVPYTVTDPVEAEAAFQAWMS